MNIVENLPRPVPRPRTMTTSTTTTTLSLRLSPTGKASMIGKLDSQSLSGPIMPKSSSSPITTRASFSDRRPARTPTTSGDVGLPLTLICGLVESSDSGSGLGLSVREDEGDEGDGVSPGDGGGKGGERNRTKGKRVLEWAIREPIQGTEDQGRGIVHARSRSDCSSWVARPHRPVEDHRPDARNGSAVLGPLGVGLAFGGEDVDEVDPGSARSEDSTCSTDQRPLASTSGIRQTRYSDPSVRSAGEGPPESGRNLSRHHSKKRYQVRGRSGSLPLNSCSTSSAGLVGSNYPSDWGRQVTDAGRPVPMVSRPRRSSSLKNAREVAANRKASGSEVGHAEVVVEEREGEGGSQKIDEGPRRTDRTLIGTTRHPGPVSRPDDRSEAPHRRCMSETSNLANHLPRIPLSVFVAESGRDKPLPPDPPLVEASPASGGGSGQLRSRRLSVECKDRSTPPDPSSELEKDPHVAQSTSFAHVVDLPEPSPPLPSLPPASGSSLDVFEPSPPLPTLPPASGSSADHSAPETETLPLPPAPGSRLNLIPIGRTPSPNPFFTRSNRAPPAGLAPTEPKGASSSPSSSSSWIRRTGSSPPFSETRIAQASESSIPYPPGLPPIFAAYCSQSTFDEHLHRQKEPVKIPQTFVTVPPKVAQDVRSVQKQGSHSSGLVSKSLETLGSWLHVSDEGDSGQRTPPQATSKPSLSLPPTPIRRAKSMFLALSWRPESSLSPTATSSTSTSERRKSKRRHRRDGSAESLAQQVFPATIPFGAEAQVAGGRLKTPPTVPERFEKRGARNNPSIPNNVSFLDVAPQRRHHTSSGSVTLTKHLPFPPKPPPHSSLSSRSLSSPPTLFDDMLLKHRTHSSGKRSTESTSDHGHISKPLWGDKERRQLLSEIMNIEDDNVFLKALQRLRTEQYRTVWGTGALRRGGPRSQEDIGGTSQDTDHSEVATSSSCTGDEMDFCGMPKNELKSAFLVRELRRSETSYARHLARLSKSLGFTPAAPSPVPEPPPDAPLPLNPPISKYPIAVVYSSSPSPQNGEIGEESGPPAHIQLLQTHIPKLLRISAKLSRCFEEDPSDYGIAVGMISLEDEMKRVFSSWSKVVNEVMEGIRAGDLKTLTMRPSSIECRDDDRSALSTALKSQAPSRSLSIPTRSSTPLIHLNRMPSWTPPHVLKRKKLDLVRSGGPSKAVKLSVLDIVVMPTQRVTRYSLFLKELVKNTDPDSPVFTLIERALEGADSIAAYCDSVRVSV